MENRVLALALAVSGLAGAPPLRADDASALLVRVFATKELKARSFGPSRWLEGGKAYATVEPSTSLPDAKEIVRYDTATGARTVLVPAVALVPEGEKKPLAIDDYALSKDGKRVLVFTNARKLWRRNTRGDAWLLDLPSGKPRKLGAGFPEATLMFVKLSPDETRAAYVQANDIYVEEIASGRRTRLTSDGSATSINGTSDWVNEEEFDIRHGFRFSPDGKLIAFWHFDATGIGSFPLVNDTDTLYPVVSSIPYPKTGTTNSAVRIGVVPTAGGEVRWVDLPGDPRNTYVPRMEWVEKTGEIVLQQMNRLQSTNDVALVDAATGKVRRLFRDQDEAWLEVVEEMPWLPGGKELLWVSERDGFRHAWAAGRDSGALRLLTPGDLDILSVSGVDEKAQALYVIAAGNDATRRYLYRGRLDGKGALARVTPKDQPGTHAYDVSPDGRFAIHTFSTFDRPPVVDLVRLPSHQVVRVLEANDALRKAAAALTAPPVELFQVDIGGGVTLDGWMLRPPSFDPSRKYPLVMYVYGEPAGVTVTDSWGDERGLFHRALTLAGYVVASVDNRGTPAPRGRAFRKVIHGAVGVLASKEQAAAVRALLATRPYLDPERVASWGWSGGGSMTLNLLFRSPELYKVGISVAPVPDQRLYDTIYQERYMGTPEGNPEGYRQGSPITFAEGLRGHLLLVHGSGDDNVHYQGTERLVNRLVELGKPFDLMVYPNRSHAIKEGEGTSLHLHQLLLRTLRERLSTTGVR